MSIFGTDGVRGLFGEGVLSSENIAKLGYSAAVVLKKTGPKKNPQMLVGYDTRYSCAAILKQLSAGLKKGGVSVVNLGVVPTPAISYLVERRKYLAGVVISASHNPWQDNGIKFFSSAGEKLSEKIEQKIEKKYFTLRCVKFHHTTVPTVLTSLVDEYLLNLSRNADGRLDGLKVVVDCANGSASAYAHKLLLQLGAEVRAVNCSPDGKNINKDCGSLHPEVIRKMVLKEKADCAISFDGDADRAVFSDEKGNYVSGDQIIGGYALYLKNNKKLKKNKVVVTVMSNYGLLKFFKENKIDALITPVGDKYVWQAMKKNGAVLGGEQSGHIIFADCEKTGDSLMTAVKVLSALARTSKKLSLFSGGIKLYPQVLVNKKVKKRLPIEKNKKFVAIMKEEEKKLAGDGRILVRYSGTEPLLRIMAEGKSEKEIGRLTKRLYSAVDW